MVFVENAVKHSSSSLTEAIDIHIDLKLEKNGEMKFSCKNSFKNVSNTESLSKGIGLDNVKKRLNLLYPGAHELTISSDDSYYEVNLILDLNKLV
jgi:LytS/YehU family sensor histidine kinase